MRRQFLKLCCLIIATIVGCYRKKPEPPPESEYGEHAWLGEPTPINPVDRVAHALQRVRSDDAPAFALVGMIVATVICSIVRYCVETYLLRMHDQVQRKPNGVAAIRLRGKISSHLAEEKDLTGKFVFADPDERRKRVDEVMTAFSNASPDEVRSLIRDLKSEPEEPQSAQDRNERAAMEWSQIVL